MAAVHTWKMDKTFWPLRLYAWAWDANLNTVNFCKFFWGLLFSPIGVFLKSASITLKFIGRPIGRGLRWLFWHIPEPGRAAEVVLRAILAVMIWATVAGLTALALFRFETFTALAVLVLGTSGFLALLIGLLYVLTEFGSTLKRQRLLVALARGGEAIVNVVVGIAFVVSRPFVWLAQAARTPVVVRPTRAFAGAAVGTISGGGGILAAFYHMIKDKTCPAIEVQGLGGADRAWWAKKYREMQDR